MYGCYECICDSITNKWATISTLSYNMVTIIMYWCMYS